MGGWHERGGMSGVAMIVTEAPGPRFAAAVELAATLNAMDRGVAMLLKEGAAGALGNAKVATALDMLWRDGVWIGLCQSAMDAHGLRAADLPPGVEALGLVAFLAERPGWQILLA
ncbi:DsrE family protein [Sandaracinobacteroides saxicola]|uniref:DsrE family protein n=1 Tax=Sandaracinobacteroides saxicola TaxID=2759707 RepID=A0A7G5IH65_9SPHN|nr:DsrE family protein [Sandaracinobacteroides saxicola]QMW22707.1 DsrE family protein [Sandaracinobacteroides saxicola]